MWIKNKVRINMFNSVIFYLSKSNSISLSLGTQPQWNENFWRHLKLKFFLVTIFLYNSCVLKFNKQRLRKIVKTCNMVNNLFGPDSMNDFVKDKFHFVFDLNYWTDLIQTYSFLFSYYQRCLLNMHSLTITRRQFIINWVCFSH